MKKAVFYFEFSNPFEVGEDEEPECVYYGFNMELDENAYDEEGYYDPDWSFECFVGDMEMEYGTHDWSSSPHDDVEGFGYSAYEAAFATIPELMEKWRAYFAQRDDFANVTDVVKLDVTLDDVMGMSDKDFYDQIAKQLGETA